MTETQWTIPESWAWTTAGEIAHIVGGGTPRTDEPANFEDGDIPWITPADLSGYKDKFISRGARNITRRGLDNSGARLMPEGTVLFSSRAPIGYVAIASNPVSTNQGFKSFVLPSAISSHYAYYYLQRARQLAVNLSSGTTFQEISGAKAAVIPFPVAPTREQRRIVAEIEKQFTRLEAAVAALKRAQTNLKRYRAAVLMAAVEGRLVPTEAELARREGRSYEPASELLKRILAERRARWEANQLAKFANARKLPNDDKWQSKYREPNGPDISELGQLPLGWVWVSLSQISWDASYGTSEKCDYKWSGPPVLRIPNIVSGKIDPSDLKFASESTDFTESEAMAPGDMVIVRTNGSRDLIGRAAVVDQEFPRPHFFASYLIRYRLLAVDVLSKWISTIWDASSSRARIEALAATTAGQYNVSVGKLDRLPIPLAPQSEMEPIVAEVQRRLSIIDELGLEVDGDLKRADRLRQAILKRAFEGKLVPQDPSDEPASVLLERIRAERGTATPGCAGSQRPRKPRLQPQP
jgi:type I restriction enzyme, S subunit